MNGNKEKRYTRHVHFVGPNGEEINARLVFDYRECAELCQAFSGSLRFRRTAVIVWHFLRRHDCVLSRIATNLYSLSLAQFSNSGPLYASLCAPSQDCACPQRITPATRGGRVRCIAITLRDRHPQCLLIPQA